MSEIEVRLEAIAPTLEQINTLYELLRQRDHSISHESMPSLDQHSAFVHHHPYRAWYLMHMASGLVGSIYVQTDNSVGLNLAQAISPPELTAIIRALCAVISPLEAVPSVRYKEFYFNIPVSNTDLQAVLSEAGYRPSQISFVPE